MLFETDDKDMEFKRGKEVETKRSFFNEFTDAEKSIRVVVVWLVGMEYVGTCLRWEEEGLVQGNK